MLLTREQFREGVFERDGHTCVFCDRPAVDAHHILERRLWPDGGYYLNNGASVCEQHHMECEMTLISVEEVREACGIEKPIIPPHLYSDHVYDKWGNVVLPNGQRLKGELFNDESVQKVLREGKVIDLFTHWVKYPRTHHVPWSPSVPADDRIVENMDRFEGQRVIVTEKMDGENTSMYTDHIHARSIDGRSHPSRDWVKNFWAQIMGHIPYGWRVCGENLYAEHSIKYDSLPTYFMGFSIWNDMNVCLSWNETLEWFELLGIEPVPVLYDGIYDEEKIKAITINESTSEGYVIRIANEFTYGDFRNVVAKWVRKDHVQTNKHWFFGQKVVENKLKEK